MADRNDTFDRASGRELIERHHGASWGWALHCCRHRPDDAEEVLQTTYLKVLDGRARFGGRSSERTWLFGVIRHTAAELRRARLMRGELFRRVRERGPTRDAHVEPPDRRVTDLETKQRLDAALQQLSPRQRDLMHLVFYQELTIEEASDVLGVSLGTARVHYERGKKRLKSLLEGAEQLHVERIQRRTDSQVV